MLSIGIEAINPMIRLSFYSINLFVCHGFNPIDAPWLQNPKINVGLTSNPMHYIGN